MVGQQKIHLFNWIFVRTESATCVPPAVQVRLSVTHVLGGLIIVQCRRLWTTSSKCCSAPCAFEVLYLYLCIFSILIIQGLIHRLCNTANCSQSLQVLIVEEALAAATCFHLSVYLYFCIFVFCIFVSMIACIFCVLIVEEAPPPSPAGPLSVSHACATFHTTC